jgi:two-component system NtrC family sensor kinase
MATRILVVDDETDILDLMRDVLSDAGYEVDVAPNAATALELIREHIFDAAILDFNLPDMDGVMLHRRIRQMDRELAERTIFTSGLVQSNENLGYYSSQAGGFLSKPFSIPDVLDAVRSMLTGGGSEK